MDRDILSALEYDAVLALLREETATPPGAALALSLVPAYDRDEVARANRLTTEALRYLERRGHLPFGAVPDVAPWLARLAIEGSVLAPLEILDLVVLMKSGRALKGALAESRQEFPLLMDQARDLPDLGNLVRYLDGKIATTGELEDTASDALQMVRREIRRRGEELKVLLDGIVARPEVARALQDTFVSIRSERHVVPIRAEAQAALDGIVHGVSGSGATVYVEPLETVPVNNAIVTLRDRESAEVQRLLHDYSDLLRGRLPELRRLAEGIGGIDLVMAKARLGRRMRAHPATIGEAGLTLAAARHPLVEATLLARGEPIVPLDLEVPAGMGLLVISGPNTGGKTVALKTVGLLGLMFQSGMPVPAERAVLPVFRGIFIDIGDRQSIAESLSTFSARIATIAMIAARLEPPALVLLDEVGTGTDPEEGAALAIAIVEHVRGRGALALATTHLEALKAHAAVTPGCANAAMDYDDTTATPTYRLVPGIPGRSDALEIAARLGLPRAILDAARALRGDSGARIAAYLGRLQEMERDLEARLAAARDEARRLERAGAAMAEEHSGLEERRRKAVAAEIETALGAIREEGRLYLAGLEDRAVAARVRRHESKTAEALRARARALIQAALPDPGPAADPIVAGTRVRLDGMGGAVGAVESVRGTRAVVVVRGKRVTVAMADLHPVGREAPPRGPALPEGVTLQRSGSAAVEPELRLIGSTVDEALARLDKYLDEVYLASLSPVRLVHGVGSGRLRRAVATHLSGHPHVEGFSSAPDDKGGAGVTIVRLRI